MKKRAVAAADKKTSEQKPAERCFKVPLVSQFYTSPELPPIADSTTKLECTSAGIYVVTAIAFALLVYQGLTTVQEVSVTVIVPIATGLEDGFVCKSLGRYSGQILGCNAVGVPTQAAASICNPPSPPVNCPSGVVGCTGADLEFHFSPSVSVTMTNVYFASHADCLSQMASIVADSMAEYYSSVDASQNILLNYRPYDGSISIGDSSAVFQMASSFELYYYANPFVQRRDGQAFCGSDMTNYYANGSIIPNSSVDIFIKNLPRNFLSGQYTCPSGNTPTPENYRAPFVSLGPYRCTKTTQITQPILQVLGSSVSNAATVMTVLSMALAWIIQKMNEKASQDKRGVDRVVPKADIATEDAAETSK